MEQQLNLRRYLAALARWWWLVLLLAAMSTAVTYFATPKEEMSYEASATIALEDQERLELHQAPILEAIKSLEKARGIL